MGRADDVRGPRVKGRFLYRDVGHFLKKKEKEEKEGEQGGGRWW